MTLTLPVGITPTGLTISHDGTVFITTSDHHILVLDHNSILTVGGFGVNKDGYFSGPKDILIIRGTENDYLLVCDYYCNRIQIFNILKKGLSFYENWKLSTPFGLAYFDNCIFVTSSIKNTIVKFDSNGTVVSSWGGIGNSHGKFKNPTGIAVSKDGIVYVCDTNNNRMQSFNTDGAHISTWENFFTKPKHIAISPTTDEIFVGDDSRVCVFSSDGMFDRILVLPEGFQPGCIGFSPSGVITISNTTSNSVMSFTP
jgi:hypothetical protein